MKIFVAFLVVPLFVQGQEVDASDILFLKIQELESEIATLRSELESQGHLVEKLLSEDEVQEEDFSNNVDLPLSESDSFRFQGINDSKSIDEVYDVGIARLNEKDYKNIQILGAFLEKDGSMIFRFRFLNEKPNMIIAGAAMIGGISYFHKFAYDLLAENERIIAQTFDAAIKGYQDGYLERICVLSSSMVFEETKIYPTPEIETKKCPPPASTYGFQKLAVEYFAKGAQEQYGLPYYWF